MLKRFIRTGILFIMTLPAWADAEPRQVISFCHTQDVGYGRSVFVAGGHPDLGNWTPTGAIKLRWTPGNIWTGQIAVRRSGHFEYKYIHRATATNQICEPTNVVWISPANLATSTVPLPPAPYEGKTVFYFSGWTQVFLLASTDGVAFADFPMERVGAGRQAGEFLYRAAAVGQPGGGLEFVFHNGAGQYDKAPYGGYGLSNYFTRLDAFVVQDGQVYNYWPAPAVSPPRIVTRWIDSTAPDGRVSGRIARIYLPRGYDEHVSRRYPVMYFHDGQNIFEDSKSAQSSANSWQVDRTATREISQGRMRETILVGLDNTASRQYEYNAPGDAYPGQPAGIGDSYLHFLIHNVRPTLDFHYRTLSDPAHTLIGGSSMGGLISLYAAYETNVFGAVMAMSPALTRATNYTATLWTRPRRPLRVYLDTGTAEGQVGPLPGGNYWEKPLEGYDLLLSQGYAVNEDLLWVTGCGAVHNELAWRARVPRAFAFLLDPREEPTGLLADFCPPRLTGRLPGESRVMALRGFEIRLERTPQLGPQEMWATQTVAGAVRLPWAEVVFTADTASPSAFLRVRAVPRP